MLVVFDMIPWATEVFNHIENWIMVIYAHILKL